MANVAEETTTGSLAAQLRYRFVLTSTYPPLVLKPGTIADLQVGVRPTFIPNSPPWFRGIINRRGALVPVFDLTQWLALGRDPSSVRRGLLIFDTPPKSAGIWILGDPILTSVVQNPNADISVFPDPLRPFISDGFDSDVGPCFEFDHNAWFRVAGGRANV